MTGGYVPSPREYFHFHGLTAARLAKAKPDALVMHPGPMNRGVEIDTAVADDIAKSAITEQVEMGVAVRMACLDVLTRSRRPVAAARRPGADLLGAAYWQAARLGPPARRRHPRAGGHGACRDRPVPGGGRRRLRDRACRHRRRRRHAPPAAICPRLRHGRRR